MGTLNLNRAELSNQSSIPDVTVPALNTDGVTGQKETEWTNTRWGIQWGYFNKIPDLKSAIIMKAIWNVGKGYTTDPSTEVILEDIRGYGKQTFDDILFSMVITSRVGGDAFAEIVKDKETGNLINLKILEPSSITIVRDDKGMITKYKQKNKIPVGVSEVEFQPEDIFHLSHNMLVDQVHGVSDIDALEKTILAENESFTDINKLNHRQARPLIMFKLKTDDPSKISAFKDKMDKATRDGENIYIPDDENTVSYEVVQVSASDFMLKWRDDIRNKFYRSIMLPQVVPGASGQSTESESKVIYLAFEQIVEREQRQIEKQLWAQLDIKIDLIPPVSMAPALASDTMKDATTAQQPSDVLAGVGR